MFVIPISIPISNYRLGSIPLRLSNTDDKKMFQSLDKNKDGKVSLDEFKSFFRDVMKQWLSMF
jgi:Ca2+-binding EF-hand superfamily protein